MRQSVAFGQMALAMLSIPMAHAGHWAMYVIYAVPVVVVLASVAKAIVSERRAAREGAEGFQAD